jgi:hypothetical protein
VRATKDVQSTALLRAMYPVKPMQRMRQLF